MPWPRKLELSAAMEEQTASQGGQVQASRRISSESGRNWPSGSPVWIRICSVSRARRKSWRRSMESQANYMWSEYELTYCTRRALRDPELNIPSPR